MKTRLLFKVVVLVLMLGIYSNTYAANITFLESKSQDFASKNRELQDKLKKAISSKTDGYRDIILKEYAKSWSSYRDEKIDLSEKPVQTAIQITSKQIELYNIFFENAGNSVSIEGTLEMGHNMAGANLLLNLYENGHEVGFIELGSPMQFANKSNSISTACENKKIVIISGKLDTPYNFLTNTIDIQFTDRNIAQPANDKQRNKFFSLDKYGVYPKILGFSLPPTKEYITINFEGIQVKDIDLFNAIQVHGTTQLVGYVKTPKTGNALFIIPSLTKLEDNAFAYIVGKKMNRDEAEKLLYKYFGMKVDYLSFAFEEYTLKNKPLQVKKSKSTDIFFEYFRLIKGDGDIRQYFALLAYASRENTFDFDGQSKIIVNEFKDTFKNFKEELQKDAIILTGKFSKTDACLIKTGDYLTIAVTNDSIFDYASFVDSLKQEYLKKSLIGD